MKTIHVFSRATPLYDVKGRIEYATSPNKQEHLFAVAGETDPAFWDRLATESQLAWRTSGGSKERKCCEAREIFDTLPNSALEEDLDELAKKIATRFTKKYGAPCVVAIHMNKTEKSLHYHLIFCERLVLQVPEIRIADRNAFLDENGVRKRTKKEILDDDGQLRPGCRIVPKGEVLSERYFGPKEEIFTSKGWMMDYKHDLADWINEELKPDKKRTVYDPYGPYLPQQRIPKGTPKEKVAEIEEYNCMVRQFNDEVDSGELWTEEAIEIKDEVMLAPNRNEALKVALGKMAEPKGMPGGQRTKYKASDTVEQNKQRLRKLYKESRLAWQKYRDEIDGTIEKKIALSNARRISAQIDDLKKEMGLFTTENFLTALRNKEEELRRKREWVLYLRRMFSIFAKLDNDYYSTFNQIDRCKKKLREFPPLFLCTKEQREEKLELYETLDCLREQQLDEWREEREAKRQYKEAKKELKKKREEVREAKRALRQHKKEEKKKEISR